MTKSYMAPNSPTHYMQLSHRDPEHGFMVLCACGEPTPRFHEYEDALDDLARHFRSVGFEGKARTLEYEISRMRQGREMTDED